MPSRSRPVPTENGRKRRDALVRPAAADSQIFHNLIGNVAEFVVADPNHAFDKVRKYEEVNAAIAVAASEKRVFGIGASALSPKAVAPNQKHLIDKIDAPFSDVGFRLAFTAPKDALFELVMKSVTVRTGVYQPVQ